MSIEELTGINFSGKTTVFMGDSITFGFYASDNAHRWTTLFCAGVGSTEDNHGVSGGAMQNIGTGCGTVVFNSTTVPVYNSSIHAALIIALGINDIGENVAASTPAQFKIDYTAAITYAKGTKNWPAKRIILINSYQPFSWNVYVGACTPPITIAADNTRATAFNLKIQQVAMEQSCWYIDIFSAMAGLDSSFFFGDGLHPIDTGHAFIANYLLTPTSDFMNRITINYIPCIPAPANGYRLKWRVAGSDSPYTDEGNFTTTPIVFTDSINPAGTCYEGFLQSDCSDSGISGSGAALGNPIPWATTDCIESGTSNYAIALTLPCSGGTTSAYLVTGGMAGDVIVVRAQFSGTIQRTNPEATRADLAIWSEHGTSDSTASQCHSSLYPHTFSITADTTISMASAQEYIGLTAITYNSNPGTTSVVLSIISINGTPPPNPIFVNGCRGSINAHVSC